MNLTVNGDAVRYDGDPRLSDYLQSRGVDPGRVAVLLNGDLVPLRERDGRSLKDGDQIEILAFAGGG
jgi:thiamine biosynthesis protein ThiS